MDEDNHINLTPLIDVVFVVLVVFILIAPLLDVEKVELAKAKPIKDEKTLELKEQSPAAIIVRKDSTITMEGIPIPLENLTAHLKTLRVNHPGANPQLFIDKEAQFGIFQEIKISAQLAGFTELDLVVKPK